MLKTLSIYIIVLHKTHEVKSYILRGKAIKQSPVFSVLFFPLPKNICKNQSLEIKYVRDFAFYNVKTRDEMHQMDLVPRWRK